MSTVLHGKHRRKAGARPERARSDARFFGRILQLFRPYGRGVTGAGLALLAAEALGLLPPLIVRDLIDRGIPAARAEASLVPIAWLAVALVAVPVGAGIVGLIREYLTTYVGQGVLFDLRERMLDRLLGQSVEFYRTTPSGEIVARAFDDVTAIRTTVTDTLVEFATNLVVVVGTLLILVAVSPALGLAAALTMPLFLIPTRTVSRWRKEITGEIHDRQAELQFRLHDLLNVGGISLMRSLGRETDERDRFRTIGRELFALRMKQALAGRVLAACVTALAALGPAIVYGYGGWLVVRGELGLGTVVAFVAYLANAYRPVTRLATAYADLSCGTAVFHRIFDFLDRDQGVPESADAVELEVVRGEVRFEAVVLKYPGKSSPALDGVSFVARPGQTVALVGPSGAGKSTALALVSRFLDPTSGTVRIDGTDLRTASRRSLGRSVGIVSQDTYLFHGSVRDNLRYAKPNATNAELEAACRTACIHDTIAALPGGYDSIVGERGAKFSGGERQRLAIARVLLADPKILLLDEATSALDSANEQALQQALAPLLRGRTTIAVAHRLSTVLAADEIVVLDAGRIVEAGPHPALLRSGGLYSRLYGEQFHAEENTPPTALVASA